MLNVFVLVLIGACVCASIGYAAYKNKKNIKETNNVSLHEEEAEVDFVKISNELGEPNEEAE
jgi:hypothetical protein